MTKAAVEVITVQRRRRWSASEKVAALLEPSVGVSAVAREAGLHPSQLYGWRWQLCARRTAGTQFAAVQIAPEAAKAGLPASGTTRPALLGVQDR
jgi:transposase